MRLTSRCQEPNPNFKLARSLRDDLGRGESVVILDCRGNDEYKREHIQGAYNIVLPQLLQRRLKANTLPLKNLVPANVTHEKEMFLSKILTSAVIIYDQQSSDLNGKDTSLQLLLHDRMAHEGCRVAILKGGFSKFSSDYPEFCSRSTDTGNDAADRVHKDLDSSDSNAALSPTRCDIPVFGLGALTLSDRAPESGNIPPVESHIGGLGCAGLLARRSRRNGRRVPGPLEIGNGSGAAEPNESLLSIPAPPISPSSCSENVESDKSDPASPSSFPAYGNTAAPAEILPYLFLGCARDAASREILSHCNITYILNVTPNLPNVFEGDEKYHYKQIAISDHWSQNLSQFFPEAIAFIDQARSENCGVLVHCLAGISRSVTVTVAYLMQKNRWSLNDAYDFVKQRKSNVSPNFNFLGQLLDFEKTLGLNSEAADSGISSSSSSNSPPTLFFTSPPPPTPKPLTVASSNVVSSSCAANSDHERKDCKTVYQASCTES